jgi:hypothetical protein
MPLSITQTALVRIVAGQAITNNLLRLLALSPSVSISGSVVAGDLAAGAVTPAATTPGAYFYAADVTNTNAYVATYSPAVGAYADGLQILLKVTNANTTAAVPSVNANGLGAKNIYHRTGQTPKAGDIPANSIVHLIYNSSLNASAGGFEIVNVTPSATIRPAVNVTTGTANAQAVVNVPPLTGYQVGQLLLVTAGASLTNTAAMTLNCDGLGTRAVKRQDGSALLSQDWVAGQTHLIYDDGTNFVLLGRRADVAVVAACRSLIIQSNTAAPDSKADLTADEVVLKTSDGQSILHSTVSLTIDAALGVALNGFETGATERVSTWYYVWLISNGTTIAAVLEDAGAGPGALPTGPDLSNGAFAGYVYKALVGQIRNNAASNFIRFVQFDREVWITEIPVLAASDKGSADTWALLDDTGAADLNAFMTAVPPNAKLCHGFVGTSDTADNVELQLATCKADGSLATDIIGLKVIEVTESTIASTYDSFAASIPFERLPVRGGINRNIQWKRRLDTIDVSLSISGYTF